MRNKLTRSTKLLIILIILLFHAGALFVLFVMNMQDNYQKLLGVLRQEQPQQPKTTQQEEWAATKARASQFGAPVIFQEEHEQEEEQPTTEPQQQQPETKTTEPAPQQDKPEQPEQEAKKEASPEPEEKQQKNGLVQEKKEEPHPPKRMPPSQPAQQLNRPIGFGKKSAAPLTKKMVSMADIANGFLHEMRHNGNHSVTMLGKEGAKVSEHQMKVERYTQRLNWYLQNSFKIHRSRQQQPQQPTTVDVFLALHRSGKIQNLRIVQSSGNRTLDDYTLFIFNDASSAFPPVPNYLPDEPFSITYRVEFGSYAPSHFRFSTH